MHRINRLVADEHLQGLKARVSFLCARKRSFPSIVPDRVTLHVSAIGSNRSASHSSRHRESSSSVLRA